MSNYQRILVGYDGSENADRALSRAASLAKAQSASLRIIVVADTISLATSYSVMEPPITGDVIEGVVKESEGILSHGLKAVSSIVPQVTGSVERGYPADCILEEAAAQESDLIVLGRRGISGIERFLIGGVSSSIVSHSKCDVLIVK